MVHVHVEPCTCKYITVCSNCMVEQVEAMSYNYYIFQHITSITLEVLPCLR